MRYLAAVGSLTATHIMANEGR